MKLVKTFFGFTHDIYLCAVYVPPITSSHYENDLQILEEEICSLSNKGKILLIGDFNYRTAENPDFMVDDSSTINLFDGKDILPDDYKSDITIKRNNQDRTVNAQGLNLLDLCLSSGLRILNGRYLEDSLGYYTCITNTGYSTVDYALITESLLHSVKYFKTNNFTYLSDHVQLEIFLECNLNLEKKKGLDKRKWQQNKSYKWMEKSKLLLVDALITDNIKEEILEFECQHFKDDQTGVEDSTKMLTNILYDISNVACKKNTKRYKRNKRKFKHVWSDEVVYETKREINALGNKIKHNSNHNDLKQKYFFLCKQLKKIVKQKKNEYNQKIYKLLTDNKDKDPKEYWKILKSLKNKKE